MSTDGDFSKNFEIKILDIFTNIYLLYFYAIFFKLTPELLKKILFSFDFKKNPGAIGFSVKYS